MKTKIIIFFLFCLSGLAGFFISLHVHKYKFESSNQVEPIAVFHSPVNFVKQLKGDPQAGRKIFKEFCASCHAQEPIIDINAPRIGDKKIWGALRKLGMPALLNITIKGVKAMPARGGCFECSDQQLQQAIEYILEEGVKYQH